MVLVTFPPLALALSQHFLLGSDQVEDFCRQIGVHDVLSRIYQPLFEFVR